MIGFDINSQFGARVHDRLQKETIAWLVTTDGQGTPQPSPVWFLWDGQSMLIYSRPDTPKLRNIAGNPRVAVHLDGDGRGGDIVVLTGRATIDYDVPPATEIPEYITKYHAGILSIGMTHESFADAYNVPVRFMPEKLRGH